MLIKVKATATTRSQIVQIADVYRGNVLDISPTSMIIEVIGSVEKLRGFIQIMETYGILEIAKTGITAMSRGEKCRRMIEWGMNYSIMKMSVFVVMADIS